MKDFYLTIGNKLKELREEANISQEEFAQKLNVTRQTISNWENEKRLPDIYMLKNIADIYEITIDELCGNIVIKEEKKVDKISGKIVLMSITLSFIYLMIGIYTKHFYGEVFISMITFSLMCSGMIHLFFKGAIEDDNFGIIAGYDSKIEYNMPEVKKMLKQCDKHIAITTLMTNILLFVSAYTKKELTIILILYYAIHLTITILLHNYKAHQTIFVHEKDRNIAKAGWVSAIWYVAMIFSICGVAIFDTQIENNTTVIMPYIGWIMLFFLITTIELFYEQHRVKKYANATKGYHVGVAFWITTIFSVIILLLPL